MNIMRLSLEWAIVADMKRHESDFGQSTVHELTPGKQKKPVTGFQDQ